MFPLFHWLISITDANILFGLYRGSSLIDNNGAMNVYIYTP